MMTLNEAIEKMRAGCVVRRSHRPDVTYTIETPVPNHGWERIIQHDNAWGGLRSEVGSMAADDILATDWEVLPKGEA